MDEPREIVSNLVQAGFPADDIMVVDGKVYVGRDAEVTLAASRELLEQGNSTEEQYRTTNLVSTSVTKICIDGSTFTGAFSTALDLAIQNYDELPLTFAMARTPSTGCSFTIKAVLQPALTGGSAGFPSNGLPYPTVNIGLGLALFSVDVIEHVITHEIGHTIGFRHSDYYNRSISCGIGGDEGASGVGAIHIPGTPTTATVGGSLMNSCFRSVETGEFTAGDISAILQLYGTVCTGQTPAGATAWQQYGADGIYLDVDTSKCRLASTPLYFTSLGGWSNHWTVQGATSIYLPTATGFRVHVQQPGITPAVANSMGMHLNWQAAPPNLRQESLCTGQTPVGATAWQQYGADGIYLDVNTAACGFGVTPQYLTSLGGASEHWTARGATSIYLPTATGFRVHLQQPGITPALANSRGWHLNWQASPSNVRQASLCTGKTEAGATAWQQYGVDGIYLDVSTAACGRTSTPLYFTSLGGVTNHWTAQGATSIYLPTATGFRVHVYQPGITVEQANSMGMHLNWVAE
ncbi:zinc-dependent metalloprotease [Pyxidicoccus parkwayensis]|uniref:zinc-dependent metalloprotease n=1 Tax=Pyxidicoccus parkwayensis TaxID=2813578 RepID=UPI002739EF35|nr:zinc-dependent metalloprotease [Pyxidicoccus parkwaysis]